MPPECVGDMCGTCDRDPDNNCTQDCADASNDCDYAGTPGGSAVLDMCGTCDEDLTNDCTQDCAGVWRPCRARHVDL